MPFPIPMHSSTRVDRAGRNLADGHASTPAEAAEDLDVVNNWRASHAYALNTFQATLRTKLHRLGMQNALVGQRLKRMPSIERKLQRNSRMRLTQMQDIAGLRAVVGNVDDLRRLVDDYHRSRFPHIRTQDDDYLLAPKADGYRSVHLMYRYQNLVRHEYNRCRVELQVRTRLQHAWATAVETIDAFTGQDIKAGNATAEWARLFVVASALLADREEFPRPEALRAVARQDLVDELRTLEHSLQLRNRLGGYASSLKQIGTMPSSNRTHAYYLVILNTRELWFNIFPFASTDQDKASEAYSQWEKRANGELDVVLVAGGNLAQLRHAYPNYFADATAFVRVLNEMLRPR